MIKHRICAAIATFALTGCSPASPAKSTVVERAPSPRPETAAAFGTCTWGEVSGAGLSLYSYACGPDRANMRLVVDESLPGFAVESTDKGGHPTRDGAIQILYRNADDPIDEIATSISAISPALEEDSCALAPAGPYNPHPEDGRTRYVWAPTGDLKAQWELSTKTGQTMPFPCGPLGVRHSGAWTFEILADDPRKVIAVSWDPSVLIFDPATIRSSESANN